MTQKFSQPKTLPKLLQKIKDNEQEIHSLKLLINKNKINLSSSNYRPRRAITLDVHQSTDDEYGSEMTSASATPTHEPGADH